MHGLIQALWFVPWGPVFKWAQQLTTCPEVILVSDQLVSWQYWPQPNCILLSLEYQNFFDLCLCSPIKGFYICICPVIQRALSNFQTGATKILPASQTHKKQNLYFFFSELFSSKVMEQELKLVFDMNFQKLIITQLLVEHVFFNHIKVMQFF